MIRGCFKIRVSEGDCQSKVSPERRGSRYIRVLRRGMKLNKATAYFPTEDKLSGRTKVLEYKMCQRRPVPYLMITHV